MQRACESMLWRSLMIFGPNVVLIQLKDPPIPMWGWPWVPLVLTEPIWVSDRGAIDVFACCDDRAQCRFHLSDELFNIKRRRFARMFCLEFEMFGRQGSTA